MVLFAITCFLSSAMIYNTMGTIDEKAVERLGFLTNIFEMFDIKRKQRADPKEVVHEIAKYFPQFVWALRDFSLDLFDNKLNREITSKEYLESSLLLDSNASKQRQGIRQCIREYFKERDCFTLPRPVNDEKLLRNIEELNYEHLKEPFKIQLEAMINSVRNNLKPKFVDNVPVDGTAFCKLAEHLVYSINNNNMPRINSTWDRIVQSEMKEILNACMSKFDRALREMEKQMPMDDKKLYRMLYRARMECSREIDTFKYSGEKCRFLREKYEKQTMELEEDFIALNESVSKERCEQVAENVLRQVELKFETIQAEDLAPGSTLNIFEKLRSSYLNSAKGTHKYDIFITKLLNNFIMQVDSTFNNKLQQTLL